MSFRRTASGLSNLHIFYRVDAVVFVEGGSKSLSLQDLISKRSELDKTEQQSNDMIFWQRMFRVFCLKKRFAFKAVGTKNTLIEIAKGMTTGAISNIIVAMDRDYDNHKGSLVTGANIFYTYGYSWENDVWNEDTLDAMFYTFCPITEENSSVRSEIESNLKEFDSSIKWAIRADIILSSNGSSLIPRDSEGGLIKTVGSYRKPQINRSRLIELIQEIKGVKKSSYSSQFNNTTSTRNDCVGHFLEKYCQKLLFYLFAKYCNMPSLPKQYVPGLAIDKFFQTLGEDVFPDCYKHYQSQFQASTIC